MTAWLSAVFCRRRYLTASILLFTFASIMCGLSDTLGALVFWRIMQGAGGAALLSKAEASLREIFPAEQQDLIQSLFTVVIVVGPTLGPAFGGWCGRRMRGGRRRSSISGVGHLKSSWPSAPGLLGSCWI